MISERASGLAPIDSVADRAAASIQSLTALNSTHVFQDPVQVGDRVVIAAAALIRGGGFGFGGGGEDQEESFDGGAGAGGGGRSEGRPVAVIEVTPEGTTVKPVVDYTKLGVMLLAGLLAFSRWGRGRRGR